MQALVRRRGRCHKAAAVAAVLLWLTLGAAAACLVANALALRVHLPRISGTRVSERPPAALVLRGFSPSGWRRRSPSRSGRAESSRRPGARRAASRGVVVLVPELGGNRAAFWLLRRRPATPRLANHRRMRARLARAPGPRSYRAGRGHSRRRERKRRRAIGRFWRMAPAVSPRATTCAPRHIRRSANS